MTHISPVGLRFSSPWQLIVLEAGGSELTLTGNHPKLHLAHGHGFFLRSYCDNKGPVTGYKGLSDSPEDRLIRKLLAHLELSGL